MSTRLSPKKIKHDIREDEFRSFIVRAFDYCTENPMVVVQVVGGVLLLVLFATVGYSYMDSRKDTANEQLAEALKIFEAPILDEGATPDDEDNRSFANEEERNAKAKPMFEDVQGAFGAGTAGDVAGLYLAQIEAANGNVDAARATWESFLKEHGDHILALSVRLNLLRHDRANGKAEAVADQLEQELASANKTLPEDVILFELAETRELLGDKEGALEIYQRIIDEHPQSPFVERARQLTTTSAG